MGHAASAFTPPHTAHPQERPQHWLRWLQPCVQVSEQWDTLRFSSVWGGCFEDRIAPHKAFFVCLTPIMQVYVLPGAKLCLACLLLLWRGCLLSTPFIQLDLLDFFFFCTFAIWVVNEQHWGTWASKWQSSRIKLVHARAAISLAPGAEWGQFWIPTTDITGTSVPALNKKSVERTLERISLQCFYQICLLEEEFTPTGVSPNCSTPRSELLAEAGCDLCVCPPKPSEQWTWTSIKQSWFTAAGSLVQHL